MIVTANQFEVTIRCADEEEEEVIMTRYSMIHRLLEMRLMVMITSKEPKVSC